MLRKFFLPLLFISFLAHAQQDELLLALKSLPDIVEVKSVRADSMFKAGYELRIRQPLDHSNPESKTFLQTVYLVHTDYSKPMVFDTEGYAVTGGTRARELTRLLRCNQIVAEHRYFGASRPDSLNWTYLTTQQAANDHHRITTLLKSLYKGKWIATGVSKGGQTTLLYRYYFPNDVDVSVPYVAPVNLAQEDPRIFPWLRSVGDAACREKIKQYQITLLERESEILPSLDKLAQQKGYQFSLGKALVYEYAVLEYPFAFWQYGAAACHDIPSPQSSTDSLLLHLEKVVGFSMYSDQSVTFYHPFFYQAYTEIGYYGYDISEFKGLLKAVNNPTNIILAPKVNYVYNPLTMQNVYTWLRDYGNNIIYIYGGNDTWSATAMELSGKTNAVKIVKPGGFHGTNIRSLPPEQKELVLKTLEDWLQISIQR